MEVFDTVVVEGGEWDEEYEKLTDPNGHHFVWADRNLNDRPLDDDMFTEYEEIHERFCEVAQKWLTKMKRKHVELREIGVRIADHLDAYVVSRLVPGRCRYCPA